MKPLAVEFVQPRPVSKWLWAALGLCLSLLMAQQAWSAWESQRLLAATQRDIVSASFRLEQDRESAYQALSPHAVAPVYAQDAATIVVAAGFPLNRVLASIESAQIQGVRVTSLDIDADQGTVKLELESVDREGAMKYLGELNAGEDRPRWQLLQAQSATTANGNTAALGSTWTGGDR